MYSSTIKGVRGGGGARRTSHATGGIETIELVITRQTIDKVDISALSINSAVWSKNAIDKCLHSFYVNTLHIHTDGLRPPLSPCRRQSKLFFFSTFERTSKLLSSCELFCNVTSYSTRYLVYW